MAGLSFISMYILMYTMVDRYAHIYNNTNQLFMAALMTMPMIIIELLIMKDMYTDKKHNFIILVISTSIFITSLLFIRTQIITSDKEFLRSMIPHHAAALLMCKARLQDPELIKLCKNISQTQQSEILFMQEKLKKVHA
jgi:hypothetical protein